MSFSLRFHEKPDGECQVKDYIRSRSKKVRGKAGWLLSRLENEGNKLERPLVGFLEDGIYELRVIVERERHRIELERRFGHEITRQAGVITKGWKEGTVVLVAGPRLLGLMRDPMRKALLRGVELKELAKDYTHLAPAELYDHLGLDSIAPARRG